MNKNLLISIVSTAIAIIALIFIIWNPFKITVPPASLSTPTPTPVPSEQAKSLGEEISGTVANPTQNMPDTNPFKKTQTNPYENSYQNPFNK